MQDHQELTESRKGDDRSRDHGGGEDKQKIEIRVNGKKVEMVGHMHTGVEIKQAAIAQHVNIGIDFLLYLLREHQPNKPVGDDEEIRVTDHSRFHAIADDDNS